MEINNISSIKCKTVCNILIHFGNNSCYRFVVVVVIKAHLLIHKVELEKITTILQDDMKCYNNLIKSLLFVKQKNTFRR